MLGFITKLNRRKEVAEKTVAFYFEKPSDFEYKAGQFVDLSLIDPPETDGEGNTRAYSIATAPHESEIMIATRIRDTAFKRTLLTMPLGTKVKIDGPFGNLVLHNSTARPAVFLTGGIGITPFRSIILSATKKKLPHRIFLFYSNRRPKDAAFMDELKIIRNDNLNFKLISTMTETEKSNDEWKDETGYINKAMLLKYLPKLNGPIYYIAGPATMAGAMQKMLDEAGIDNDDVKIEEFSGY